MFLIIFPMWKQYFESNFKQHCFAKKFKIYLPVIKEKNGWWNKKMAICSSEHLFAITFDNIFHLSIWKLIMSFALYHLLKLNGSSCKLDFFTVNLVMLGFTFVDQVLLIIDNCTDHYVYFILSVEIYWSKISFKKL